MSGMSGSSNRPSTGIHAQQIGAWPDPNYEALLQKEAAISSAQRKPPTADRPAKAENRPPVISTAKEQLKHIISLDRTQLRLHHTPQGDVLSTTKEHITFAAVGRTELRSNQHVDYANVLQRIKTIHSKDRKEAQKTEKASQEAALSSDAEGLRILQQDRVVRETIITHRDGLKDLFIATAVSASEKCMARIVSKRKRNEQQQNKAVRATSKASRGPGMFGGTNRRKSSEFNPDATGGDAATSNRLNGS